MSHEQLRPPVPLVVASLGVIAWCAWMLSKVAADMVVAPNLMLIPGLLVMAPLLVVVIAFQYFGTFRGDASAASGVRVLYYVLGGGALLMALGTAGGSLDDPEALALMGSFFGTLLVFSIAAGLVGWLNGRWARALRADATGAGRGVAWRDITKRDLLVFAGVLVAIGILSVSIVKSSPPRFAEHVTAAEAPVHLPDGATDVSYALGFRGTQAYEFTTDEASFRAWVDSGIGSIESETAEVPLREIVEPRTITRYFQYAPALDGPERITVEKGLSYRWSKEDRGVYALYDRPTGRAYFAAHFH